MTERAETYIFRHPHLKMRKENFGGLARADSGVYLLGEKEFSALCNLPKFLTREKAGREIGLKLLEGFLDVGLVLEIEQQRAHPILNRLKGGDNHETA